MLILNRVFFLFATCLILFNSSAVSQQRNKEQARIEKNRRINQMIRNEEEGVPAFEKHSITSIKNHHDGWGIAFEKGFSTSAYKTTILQLELTEKQHRKEQKQSTPGSINRWICLFWKTFCFWQTEYFLPRPNLDLENKSCLVAKAIKTVWSVYGIFLGGFSAGLARPYYIQFSVDTGRCIPQIPGRNQRCFS